MSKYKEMQDASAFAAKNWFELQERCWAHIAKLVHGFRLYCDIPADRLRVLKWNGLSGEDREYAEPEGGGRYFVPTVAEFDSEEGFWHLGISITLTPEGSFPPQWFAFILCVGEKEGEIMVRVGSVGKPSAIDFEDKASCDAFYKTIVDKAIQMVGQPTKPGSKTMGFVHTS